MLRFIMKSRAAVALVVQIGVPTAESPAACSRLIALSLLLLLGPLAAWSPSNAVTYTYTGNSFDTVSDSTPPLGSYTTSMAVTIMLELPAPLAPNLINATLSASAFSFFDGRNTITDADAASVNLTNFSTDVSGNIISWTAIVTGGQNINVGDQYFAITSRNDSFTANDSGSIGECWQMVGSSCFQNYDSGSVVNPASWVLVPEPTAEALLCFGLVGLTVRRRPGRNGCAG
jgi:hypothetical protein